MYEQKEKPKAKQQKAVNQPVAQKKNTTTQRLGMESNPLEAIAQRHQQPLTKNTLVPPLSALHNTAIEDNRPEAIVLQKLKGNMKIQTERSDQSGTATPTAQLMFRSLTSSYGRVTSAATSYGARRTITSFAAPTNRQLMFIESLQTGMSVRQAAEFQSMIRRERLMRHDFETWLANNRTFGIGRAGPSRLHLTNRSDAASAYSGTSAMVEHNHEATSPLPGLIGVILHVDLYVLDPMQVREFNGGHERMGEDDTGVVGIAERVNIPGGGRDQEGLDVSVSTRAMAEDPYIYLHITRIEEREITEDEQQNLLKSQAMKWARRVR